FAGEPVDGVTHLAYFRTRWMDSKVGRFTAMDRFAGFAAKPTTLHRYRYASCDPVNRVDPEGTDDFGSFGAIGSIVGINATFALPSFGSIVDEVRKSIPIPITAVSGDVALAADDIW